MRYTGAMAPRDETPSCILITGASSGIGAALAAAYAAPGRHLVLTGRSAERLDAVARACRDRGATVAARALDVTDGPAMADWIATLDDARPLDLVIANAGISAGAGDGGESAAQARQVLAVNLDGVVNTVYPALERFRARGRGQVAVIASVAGYRGLPGAPAYAASKAAVKAWGEGLRPLVAAEGVKVNVVCPGWVESRMTADNRFPMPFLMTSERAAVLIQRGLARNRARITFPWQMAILAWFLGALPPAWLDPILARAPRKD